MIDSKASVDRIVAVRDDNGRETNEAKDQKRRHADQEVRRVEHEVM